VDINLATAEIGIGYNSPYLMDDSVDAPGIWDRQLTESERVALYAAGAGVEWPWSQIASLLGRPTNWASRSIEERQRIIWAKNRVFVPEYMFPTQARVSR
jgi:hypothetical protein